MCEREIEGLGWFFSFFFIEFFFFVFVGSLLFYGVGSIEKIIIFVKIIMLFFFEDRLFLNIIVWIFKVKKW